MKYKEGLVGPNATTTLHTEGEWWLTKYHYSGTYNHYINHQCDKVRERYMDGQADDTYGSKWSEHLYFYHDDDDWTCSACEMVCPEGLQALLTMIMMDQPAKPAPIRVHAGPWGTFNPRSTPKPPF